MTKVASVVSSAGQYNSQRYDVKGCSVGKSLTELQAKLVSGQGLAYITGISAAQAAARLEILTPQNFTEKTGSTSPSTYWYNHAPRDERFPPGWPWGI
jgi:hypothetical protein